MRSRLCLTLVVAVLAGCSGGGAATADTSAAPARTPSGTFTSQASGQSIDVAEILGSMSAAEKAQAYTADVAEVHDRITRLQAVLDRLPAPLTDVSALAATLPTPQAAFEFVRDQIALEPYPGNLKTPRATLITRGGNSLDRALLLAAILKTRGVAARIAHGTLAPDRAKTLLQQITTRPDAVPRMLTAVSASSRQDLSPSQRELSQPAASRTEAAGAFVSDAVNRMSVPLAAAMPPARTAAEKAAVNRQLQVISDHYWVQATINGAATSFDPSDAGAAPNQTLTTATATFDPDRVEDRLLQKVRFRIVAEYLEDAGVKSVEVLSKQYRAADLFATPIRISMGPQSSAEDEVRCDAFLLVGTERTDGQTFRLSGTEQATGAGQLGGAAGKAAGGFMDALGGGGGPAVELPALGRLAVEVTSSGPFLDEVKYRRVVLDRFDADGTGIDQALADDKTIRPLVLQTWDAAESVGPDNLAFVLGVQLQAAKARAAMEEKALAHLYRGAAFGGDDLAPAVLAPQLVSFFLSSDLTRFSLQGAGTGDVRWYYERPRLAFLRHGFQVGDWSQPEGVHRFTNGIDLVNAPLQWMGRADDVQRLAIASGVADTALEAALFGGSTGFNTLPLAASAEAQGISMQTVTEASQMAQLNVPAPIRRVLDQEIAEGRSIVAPLQLVSLDGVQTYGWWSIDSRTGIAIGRMELGGAQGLAETAKMHERVGKWTEIFGKFYGDVLQCYLMALNENIGGTQAVRQLQFPTGQRGQNPMPDSSQLAACVVDAACSAIADLLAEAIVTPAFAKEATEFSKGFWKIIFEWQAEKQMKGAVTKGFKSQCKAKK